MDEQTAMSSLPSSMSHKLSLPPFALARTWHEVAIDDLSPGWYAVCAEARRSRDGRTVQKQCLMAKVDGVKTVAAGGGQQICELTRL